MPSRRTRTQRLGQNFLVNRGVIRSILDAAVPEAGASAIEIGPGHGALTVPLVERVRKLVAVELDTTLADALSDRFADDPRFSIVRADAAQLPWDDALAELGASDEDVVTVLGNLPYSAASPILLGYLERAAADSRVGRGVFMVQAEVADRIRASPGSRTYGSLSVTVQSTHACSLVCRVAPGSFRPAPRVRSAVLRLERADPPLVSAGEWAGWTAFVRHAFASKRKQLARSLAGLHGHGHERWQDWLDGLEAAPTARAEQLSPEQLVRLWREATTVG